MARKKYYQHVVFMQEHEADEPMSILKNDGVDAVIKYLAQWDYGEGEVRDRSSAGTGDRVVYKKGYKLSYDPGLPYIGLERVLSKKPRNA